MTLQDGTDGGSSAKDNEFHVRAVGFRSTANDLQKIINQLASGNSFAPGAALKVFGYSCSIAVLRALAAECTLKAIAYARSGSFQAGHDLLKLFEALDGKAKGFIEKTADSQGVASPRRVLKRHRNDFVEWRYPAGESQSMSFLDLDRVLGILDDVYRRVKSGKGP